MFIGISIVNMADKHLNSQEILMVALVFASPFMVYDGYKKIKEITKNGKWSRKNN